MAIGTSFQRLPEPLRSALATTFGVLAERVEIIEYSWRVRWHPRMRATTRRYRIYLRGSLAEFTSNPALVLHEYFHVLEQWHTGRLTRLAYVAEWLRRGYAANRFEIEAREFTARQLGRFRRLLDGGG